MNIDAAINGISNLFSNDVILIAPVFIIVMVVTILVGMIQAMTQLQDQTLSFIPKMLTLIFIFYFLGNWMFSHMVNDISAFIKTIPGML